MRKYFEAHEQEDILNKFIKTGCFINLRKNLKRMALANKSHPMSKKYIRSATALRSEQYRNLMLYYNTIHPFSTFSLYWEFVMIIIFTILLILIPLELTCYMTWQLMLRKLVFDLFHIVHIFVCFFTGYYNQHSSRVILSLKDIAIRYIKSFFLVDFLSVLPTILFFMIVVKPEYMKYINMLALLKLLRYRTWLKYIENYKNWKGYSVFTFKLVKLVLIILLILVWLCSIEFNVLYLTISPTYNYTDLLLQSLFKTLVLVFGIGHDPPPTLNEYVLIDRIIYMCLGLGLQMYIYANSLELYGIHTNIKSYHENLAKQVELYVAYKKLPMVTHDRICKYFEFKYQRRFYKGETIMETLNTTLRQEVILFTTQALLDKVDIFHNLPKALLEQLVGHLNADVYLPNDIIVRAGTVGKAMYFLNVGTVAVFTASGKEICHLEDESYFGEIALFLNKPREITVVAVSACEIYRLKKVDFAQMMEAYPELWKKMDRITNERILSIEYNQN